jgi:isopentenyl-diphosphate delta-isomerase
MPPDLAHHKEAHRMTDLPTITQRKEDHIEVGLTRPVAFEDVTTGLERYQFIHEALPEMSLGDVDLGTRFLGHALGTPILISSMTGGVRRGWEVTRRLARVAQAHRGAIGVGSQRAALLDPSLAAYFQVRDIAPDVVLLANLGAGHLASGDAVEQCQRAIDMVGADALILHLNPLQEAIQHEGERDYAGVLSAIEAVCRLIHVPVVVKEVGCGISGATARRLADAGIAAIDVSGAGGTSWSAVEGQRAATNRGRRLGETFRDWGIPTAVSLAMVREAVPGLPVIASGGLKTGLDAAKAIALGASLAGFAGAILRAAALGEDTAFEELESIHEELRIAMYCAGARSVRDLRPSLLMDRGRAWVGVTGSCLGQEAPDHVPA